MSIMLPRYSGFPPEIFELGIAVKMKGAAFPLYIFLCRVSDKASSRRFTVTDREVIVAIDVSKRSLTEARSVLSGLRVIQCERVPGGCYTYVLCNVRTGLPFPGDPKAKVPYVSRDKSALQPPARDKVIASNRSDPLRSAGIEKKDESEVTLFNYGFNQTSEDKVYFGPDAFDW